MAGFPFGDKLFSLRLYGGSSLAGSIQIMPFFYLWGFRWSPEGWL
jgi:hypothetical protein